MRRRRSATRVSKFWRILLVRLWDGALVRRSPLLYSKAFDRGSLNLGEIGEGTISRIIP